MTGSQSLALYQGHGENHGVDGRLWIPKGHAEKKFNQHSISNLPAPPGASCRAYGAVHGGGGALQA